MEQPPKLGDRLHYRMDVARCEAWLVLQIRDVSVYDDLILLRETLIGQEGSAYRYSTALIRRFQTEWHYASECPNAS